MHAEASGHRLCVVPGVRASRLESLLRMPEPVAKVFLRGLRGKHPELLISVALPLLNMYTL